MDIVVRTPHGDADVSITAHSPTTTLGEVVAAVTGQAVPRLALVDDRTVDAATLLDDVGVLLGSVVTTEPAVLPATSSADVDLVQIAGHGAGRVTRLGPGRYRIGPGRRSNADELDMAPVERAAFELVVEPTNAASEVTVISEGTEMTLDGTPISSSTPWRQGTVTIGSRAFQLDSPARSDPARSVSMPDADGTVAFSRPPRGRSAPDRRPVVDAVRDAMIAAPTLWQRRPGHPDAFALPIGVRVDGSGASVVSADLGSDRAVAVTGSERFRSALARTLVVEATTLHGPADLDVVVLTDPDRLAQWDWAKWLPHLRLDGPPAILSSRHDISRWADGAGGRAVLATTPWISSHLTLVVVDDPGLWNRRDSPLRSIISNPPDDVRLIALCDDATQAPAVCTTVISETADGLARLRSFTRADNDDGLGGVEVKPALTEATVAVRVARALAALADVDLPATSPVPTSANDRVELTDLLGVAEADDIVARWAVDDPRDAAAIGRRGDELVEVAVAGDVTVVVGSSMGDAFDVAATSLLAQCVERSPDALWVVPMMLERSSRSDLLARLPHATDPHDVDSTVEPQRLIARLRAVLADPEGPDRIVLVTEDVGASSTSPDQAWLAALADGVHSTSGLAMVVNTDRVGVSPLVGDVVIRVEPFDDRFGSAGRRRATVLTRDGAREPVFAPLQRSASPVAALELRPYVVGRALTPLERRIEQYRATSANAPDPALDTGVALLERAAARYRDQAPAPSLGRVVVPPAMPAGVDLVELFDTSPGDGVPLGLVDYPSTAGVRTHWWEPGSGSLFVFGSRRSGVEQALATISLGIVDRFSTLDVRLVVIEPSSARRRALASTGYELRLVSPDIADEVDAALDEIANELLRLAVTTTRPDGPRMVVSIGDLVHLRARYADQPLGSRIDEVLTTAARPGSGVDVIAYAAEYNGAGPFPMIASSRLVGASSEYSELAALGVDHPGDLEGIVGRCRSFPGGGLVQLAVADTTVDALLLDRGSNGTPE